MSSRFSLGLAGRLWAALLVLTIAFHAGTPVSAALDLRTGSAFSADTVEVAIAPVRRAAVQQIAAIPMPPIPAPMVLPVVRPATVQPAHRWPDPTGPPVRAAPLALKSAPRAPPIT